MTTLLELLGFACVVAAVALLAGGAWALLAAGSGLILVANVLSERGS